FLAAFFFVPFFLAAFFFAMENHLLEHGMLRLSVQGSTASCAALTDAAHEEVATAECVPIAREHRARIVHLRANAPLADSNSFDARAKLSTSVLWRSTSCVNKLARCVVRRT